MIFERRIKKLLGDAQRAWFLFFLLVLLFVNPPAQSAVPDGPELEIVTGVGAWIRNPDVGMASSGEFFVVWMGENYNVFGRRFDNTGTPLGPELQINTTTQNDTHFPRIATNSSGSSVVVWASHRKIIGQCFDPMGNTVGLEFEVYADTAFTQLSPSVGIDAAGDFAVAWVCPYTGWPSNYTTILCRRFDDMANPVGPHFEVNDIGYSFRDDICDVSMNEWGAFIIVWESASNDRMFQRYNNEGVLLGGNTEMVTTWGGTAPSVAMNNTGNFVIAWMTWRTDGSGFGIAGQRYDDTGAEIGSDFQINTYSYLDQQYPAIAMDNSGRFAAVWQSCQEDSISSWYSWGVFGQQYAADGTMNSTELHVNTYVDDRQDLPRISMIDGDRFVVVWDSTPYNTLTDTLHSGIYGQIYGPEGTAVASVHGPSASLSQNFPNPFNPSTTIQFSLDRAEDVTVTIYDTGGRRIRTLVDRRMNQGPHAAVWDGRNTAGRVVASGVYFYRLQAGQTILTRRMVFLK